MKAKLMPALCVLLLALAACSGDGGNATRVITATDTIRDASALKFLLVVGSADGQAQEIEQQFFYFMGLASGFVEDEIVSLIRECTSSADEEGNLSIEYSVPDNDEAKESLIRAAMMMAAIDGKIGDEELAHVKNAAKEYGFSDSYVDDLATDKSFLDDVANMAKILKEASSQSE